MRHPRDEPKDSSTLLESKSNDKKSQKAKKSRQTAKSDKQSEANYNKWPFSLSLSLFTFLTIFEDNNERPPFWKGWRPGFNGKCLLISIFDFRNIQRDRFGIWQFRKQIWLFFRETKLVTLSDFLISVYIFLELLHF